MWNAKLLWWKRLLFPFQATKITVFQNVTSCILVDRYQCFIGTCYLHLQGKRVNHAEMKFSNVGKGERGTSPRVNQWDPVAMKTAAFVDR
jgi:hypothetical protein